MPSLLAIIRFPNAVERSFDSNQAIDLWTSNDRLMSSGRSLKHYSSVIIIYSNEAMSPIYSINSYALSSVKRLCSSTLGLELH